MGNKDSLHRVQIFMGLLYSIGAIAMWIMILPKADSVFHKFVAYFGVSFIALLALISFLTPFKESPVFKQFYILIQWIYGILVIGVVGINALIGPIFIAFLLVGIQVVFWQGMTGVFHLAEPSKIVVAYIIALTSMILLSYKGVYLIHFVYVRLLKVDGELHQISHRLMLKFFSTFHFRRRAYEFTTILYILSTVESLSGKPILSLDIWNSYSRASLAILLTFISIDRYVNAFMPSVIQKERDELNILLEQYKK